MESILSVNDLASRLDVPVARLRAVAAEIAADVNSHYRERPRIDKKNKHKVRHLRVPDDELKEIQRRIKRNVLDAIALSDGAHGGVRGRSARSNAMEHLGQPCVVTIDVRNFFDNIRHYVVYRMFKHELGFGRDVAYLLTRLTTLGSRLPQGAPTSTAIANLILALPVDGPIHRETKRVGVRYTRFVDDITFSGRDPRPLINVVGRLLSRRRLPMWRKKAKWQSTAKLRITPSSRPQTVTGLIVNRKAGPSISRARRDMIRSAIFGLRSISDDVARRHEVNSIRGRIAHVRQFNPGAAGRLERLLESTLVGGRE